VDERTDVHKYIRVCLYIERTYGRADVPALLDRLGEVGPNTI